MASKELIDKVAREMQSALGTGLPWHLEREDEQEFYLKLSQAAISTILAALQEPTEGMILSYEEYMNETKTFSRPHGVHVWTAILNASPLGEQSE